jgi:hypothetical protein
MSSASARPVPSKSEFWIVWSANYIPKQDRYICHVVRQNAAGRVDTRKTLCGVRWIDSGLATIADKGHDAGVGCMRCMKAMRKLGLKFYGDE